VDDQVLGVNIETVAGLDGHEDHQEEADPLHDEDTEDDHSLITITEALWIFTCLSLIRCQVNQCDTDHWLSSACW